MELMDVVDRDDNVIGKASKKEIYEKSLRHRIVHILMFNKKGEMLLQLRSKNVGFHPNSWSTSVGGHVGSGETYEEAAIRECKEELGVKCGIELFSKDIYESNDHYNVNKFLVTFKTVFDGPFDFDKEDVEKIGFFTIDEIREMVESGESFHPELLFLLKKYYF
jgi:isopentenyldiphosphate isomerase